MFLDCSSTSNTGGVFSRACDLDCLDEDLKRVSTGQKVDNLKSVPDDSDSLNFLSCVSAMELHGANEPLNNGAESFPEFLHLISAGCVGHINLRLGRFAGDVVDKAGIFDLDIIIRPLGEQLRGVFELGFGCTFSHELDVLGHIWIINYFNNIPKSNN